MKLLNSFAIFAISFFCVISLAQSANDTSKSEDAFFEDAMKPTPPPLAKIENVLRTYANTIGCDFSMNRKNIVEIDIDKSEDEEKEFVALFNIDAGCLGGSGTGKSSIAVLKYRDIFHKDEIYVRAELSEPSVASYGFPRLIDHIFVKNGQLWYTGKINKKGDANNLPTFTVQAKLKLVKKETSIDNHKLTNLFYWQSSNNYEK